MHLNRELMGVADSLERTTAEWEASVAELEAPSAALRLIED